jgi:hypothetical protein
MSKIILKWEQFLMAGMDETEPAPVQTQPRLTVPVYQKAQTQTQTKTQTQARDTSWLAQYEYHPRTERSSPKVSKDAIREDEVCNKSTDCRADMYQDTFLAKRAKTSVPPLTTAAVPIAMKENPGLPVAQNEQVKRPAAFGMANAKSISAEKIPTITTQSAPWAAPAPIMTAGTNATRDKAASVSLRLPPCSI